MGRLAASRKTLALFVRNGGQASMKVGRKAGYPAAMQDSVSSTCVGTYDLTCDCLAATLLAEDMPSSAFIVCCNNEYLIGSV